MKSYLFLLFALLHSIVLGQAQTHDGWNWLSPIPYGGTYKSIEMIGSDSVYVGGYNGKAIIMRSTDQGVTWTNLALPNNLNGTVTKIKFLNNFEGYACTSGKLIKTINGGNTWQVDTSYNHETVYWNSFQQTWGSNLVNNFYFINSDTGLSLRGVSVSDLYLYKTTDRGKNWDSLSLFFPRSYRFFSSTYGLVLAGAQSPYGVYETTDGGSSWNLLYNTFGFPSFGPDLATFFQDSLNHWFVMNNFIIRTADGGINFDSTYFSNEPGYFYSNSSPQLGLGFSKRLYFTSPNVGWLTGRYHIWKTTDNGVSWNVVYSLPDAALASAQNHNRIVHCQFVDSLNGWITEDSLNSSHGTRFLRTSDGGNIWSPVETQGLVPDGYFYFINDTIGYGNGVGKNEPYYYSYCLWKTTDAGNSWFREFNHVTTWQQAYPDFSLNQIQCFNENDVWCLYRKAGETRFHYNPINRNPIVIDLSRKGDSIYILVEDSVDNFNNNLVLRKNRTSQRWIPEEVGTQFYRETTSSLPYSNSSLMDGEYLDYPFVYRNGRVVSIHNKNFIYDKFPQPEKTCISVNDNELSLLGTYVEDNNYSRISPLYSTSIGGPLFQASDDICGGIFVNLDTTFLIGDQIYRSNDGGFTFGNLGNPGKYMNAIDFANPTIGFIAADDCEVYGTINSGNFWSISQKQQSVIEGAENVFFTSSSTGYITSPQTVFQTIDGGNSWNPVISFGSNQPVDRLFINDINSFAYVLSTGGTFAKYDLQNGNLLNSQNQVRDFHFISTSEGWFVTSNEVYHTSDGGDNWNQLHTFNTIDLNTLFFVDANKGYVGGDLGKMQFTTNGGTTWQNISVAGVDILSLSFVSPDTGFAGGTGGNLFTTKNGGLTWTPKQISPQDNINQMRFFDAMKGYVVTSEGILRTSDGGNSFEAKLAPVFDNDHHRERFVRFGVTNDRKTSSIGVLDSAYVDLVYVGNNNILRTTTNSSTGFGASGPQADHHIQVFPNPSNSSISFALDQKTASKCTILLIDVSGKVITPRFEVQKRASHSLISMDVSRLDAGIYFLSVQSPDRLFSSKIIIAK